jgi:hypothetical protein
MRAIEANPTLNTVVKIGLDGRFVVQLADLAAPIRRQFDRTADHSALLRRRGGDGVSLPPVDLLV